MTTPLIPAPVEPPVWIDRHDRFQRMVDDLARCSQLALDTESNSLYAYREQVCLIQFSTGKKDYLVDPLTLPDLSNLGPLFADERIEKIFHAAEYDVICLKRNFGFKFSNIFDTMVACRILGREAVGLGSILEAEFGIELDKRYQRANWGQRPLPAALLAYARLDSHYLIQLRQKMKDALEEAGRWGLALEEFRRLCETQVPEVENGPMWVRIRGAQELTPEQAAVLEELCRYRDRQAQIADLPVFKVLSNQSLVEIAQLCPGSLAELKETEILAPRLAERHAGGLLIAVQRGLKAQPLRRQSNHRPDDRYLARLDHLRTWRKQIGQLWGVESDVILPRDVMESLAAAAPREMNDLSGLLQNLPYRLEHFGEEILHVLNP